jgi:hypothetical protein
MCDAKVQETDFDRKPILSETRIFGKYACEQKLGSNDQFTALQGLPPAYTEIFALNSL